MRLSSLPKPLGFIVIAALPTGSNLLLTLVLVRGLGIDGFAAWSIIEPMILIFGAVSALGMHQGVLFVTASGAAAPERALGNALAAAFPMAFLLATLAWVLTRGWLEGVGYLSLVLPLMAETLSLPIISSLRGQRRIGTWIAFESIRSLGLVFVAFAALWLDLSWVKSIDHFLLLRGIFTGAAVVAVAMFLKARPRFDRQLVLRMVKYGAPIAGAMLLSLTTASTDRFLLAAFQVEPATIASYAAHQRLTGILGVLTVTPLNLWFAVEAMRRDTVAEASFFQAVVVMLLTALAALMLLAFIGGPLVWPWLFPGIAFSPVVFAILTVSVVPQALAIVFNIGGLREKKTHLGMIVVACGSLTMLTLGVPLVHYAAAVGAALARLASYVANVVAGRAVSQRVAPVPHPIAPFAPLAAAMAAAIGSLFHVELGVPMWLLPTVTAALVALTLFRQARHLRTLLKPKLEAPATALPAGTAAN